MRKRICIISFSPVYRDARVLRQIEYLSPHYDLTVIGYGPPHPEWAHLDWKSVQVHSSPLTRLTGGALLVMGRALPALYDVWYWQKPHHRQALRYALESGAHAYHANDWNALPVGAHAALHHQARLILDAHEYAPLEFEDRWHWRLLYRPLVTYVLRRYTRHLSAATTVAPAIAARYKLEFGFEPVTVLNAPRLVPLPPRRPRPDPDRIHLVYHGGVSPDRRIETMLEAVALADNRFSLHLILVDPASPYVRRLEALARRLAPERIAFHEPVPPADIVRRIAAYDMGFYLLRPSSFNNRVALPNKFFDFVAAGLAVCVGPGTGMAQLVEEYGFGVVTPSFDPQDVAAALNRVTPPDLLRMQQAAHQAARHINADVEMAKLVHLYQQLLSTPTAGA
jgi:glycosyltransferase involved in cell wall biosynthesis